MTLLHARSVSKTFRSRRSRIGGRRSAVHAVDGVTLSIAPGETVALVGESGSGKSTFGRLVLGLISADEGDVSFDGVDVRSLPPRQLRSLRRRMQMIFQDPHSSMNPRFPIGTSVAEPLKIHGIGSSEDRAGRARSLLARVGLEGYEQRLPYELSGGQLQRVAIARALATEPDLIVCDEPVAALDVSVRAQVMNLLQDLQEERGIAYLFISHDLSLVRIIADRVAVMYRGRIVESASAEALYEDPRHPYTKALLGAIPVPNPRRRATKLSSERVANNSTIPDGCAFAPRCQDAMDRCWTERPVARTDDAGDREVSCHLY